MSPVSSRPVLTGRQLSHVGGMTGFDLFGDHVGVVGRCVGLLDQIAERGSVSVGLLQDGGGHVDRGVGQQPEREGVARAGVDARAVCQDRLGVEDGAVSSVIRTSRRRPPAPASNAPANW